MSLLLRRRILMASLVEKDVEQVEDLRNAYLTNNGTFAYINTGFTCDSDTSIEIKFATSTINTTQFVFGSRQTAGVNRYGLLIVYNGLRSDYNSNNTTSASATSLASANTLYTVRKEKNRTSINGTYIADCLERQFDTSYNAVLFSINTANTINTNVFLGKIYYCKIWNGDTLVRDLVAKLDTSSTPCMYDNVSKTYYYKQGTGSFTYGTD